MKGIDDFIQEGIHVIKFKRGKIKSRVAWNKLLEASCLVRLEFLELWGFVKNPLVKRMVGGLGDGPCLDHHGDFLTFYFLLSYFFGPESSRK